MISDEKMKESLGRLGLLKRFPGSNSRTLAALTDILDEICQDDTELTALVGEIVDRHDEWPGPATLRQIHAEKVVPRRPPEARPEGCEVCGGTGSRQIAKLCELSKGMDHLEVIRPEGTAYEIHRQIWDLEEQYRGSKTHLLYTACSEYCSCPLGRYQAKQHAKARRESQSGPYVRVD
jgi:hypothetical protein